MVQNEANYAEEMWKSWFEYFFKFECLNMLDNADYDSTNGSFSFDYHKLPGLRAELCKIRLIMWKKSQNIDF